VSREPNFDELIGPETTGAERERLRQAHELLVQAGPPPELPPRLLQAPGGVEEVRVQRRRAVKRRTLLLLAAALSVVLVFGAGYGVANFRHAQHKPSAVAALALKGTSLEPRARASLVLWHPSDGNWPMTLNVVGLSKLPPGSYYEVYLVRNGRIKGSCGSFRVSGPHAVRLTLSAPYPLRSGDTWIVTRRGRAATEPGKTVLQPVPA
jgi:hypothetical protein